MGDIFDLNNDGKIDNIEGAMRWDMIDHVMSDSHTSGGSTTIHRGRNGLAMRPYSEQDFKYGIINRALCKDAKRETREEALKKCEDVLKESPPVRPERKFSKWYVIGILVGIGYVALWFGIKNPVALIGAPVMAWFFMLPAEHDYSREKMQYEWGTDAYHKKQQYAKKYAEQIRTLMENDLTRAEKSKRRRFY